MKLNLRKRKKQEEPKSFVKEWFNSIVFAVIAATLIRWTAVEAFVVPTPSMENTILVGDYLFVSKFHYGTRTTTTPLQIPLTHQKIPGTSIPSYLDWIRLPSYRLPGFSEIKREDVVVFNVPPLSLNDGVDHPVQLKTFYVKRCVGVPGDLIRIVDSRLIVNDESLAIMAGTKFKYKILAREGLSTRTMKVLGIDNNDAHYMGRSEDGSSVYIMYLTAGQVSEIRNASYISSVAKMIMDKNESESDIFPGTEYFKGNGDNYGPVRIPKKGMTIILNDSTLAAYGETIKLYDSPGEIVINNNKMYRNGVSITEYTFGQDYYFMMGDNRHNSLDSRYWGFVPYDHIVGKPLFIWMSIDSDADFIHRIRWSRLFSSID